MISKAALGRMMFHLENRKKSLEGYLETGNAELERLKTRYDSLGNGSLEIIEADIAEIEMLIELIKEELSE